MKIRLKLPRINIHQITTTYALLGIFIVLSVMVILIKDPWHLIHSDKKTSFIEKVPAGQVNKIEITINQNTQTLIKEGSNWVVESKGNVPAQQDAVAKIITKALELNRKDLVAKLQESHAKFNVDDQGIRVKIFGSERTPIGDFYVGKAGPDYLSTYLRKEGENFVYLYPENIREIFSQPDLRDLSIIKLSQNEITKIQGEENGNAVTIEKQEEGWKVVAPLEVVLAEDAIKPLMDLFNNFNAVDVKIGLSPQEIGTATPRKILIITTQDKNTKTLKVGQKVQGENETNQSYLTLDGDNRIFIINEETVKTLPSRIADLQSTK